jgi:hypothetical protein
MLKIMKEKDNQLILHLFNPNRKFLKIFIVDKKVFKLLHFVKEHAKTVELWVIVKKNVRKDQEKLVQNLQVKKSLQMM